MSHFDFDCVVAGAGVVGLAVARRLALAGERTLLVDAAESFGTGISSRNSEVIHAGLYYAPGSLKARLCIAGKEALYTYCAARGVPTRRLGKVIVAVGDGERSALLRYRERANACGVHDLELLEAEDVRVLEPAVEAVGGLFSPGTGIIDSHAFMLALLGDFEANGGLFVARTPVIGGAGEAHCMLLYLGGAEPYTISTRRFVNATGLGAQQLARSLQGVVTASVPPLFYAIGHYFSLRGAAPFRHLVYPVAVPGGLGVHVTLDLSGRAKFGPDVSWREHEDFTFDATRIQAFYQAIRRYWPGLQEGALEPGYTGIRPKLWGPGEPDQDFVVQGRREHGVRGLINLFGIESPGLTSSLAIADLVFERLQTES